MFFPPVVEVQATAVQLGGTLLVEFGEAECFFAFELNFLISTFKN